MPVTIPGPQGNDVMLDPQPGAPIIFVGPNGSGKSALSFYLSTRLGANVNRILSYRRLWLESAAISLTGNDRQSWASNFGFWDANPQSRWRDQNDQVRLAALIYDLLSRQSFVDGEIARRARAGESFEGFPLDGPLETLNGILDSSSLPISLFMGKDGALMCRGGDGVEYSAAEMSDGEKAALVLVADILVAEPGAIHVIDEPERHLHRSISGSLVRALIETRPSDSFLIFTHDLNLAQYLGRQGSVYVCRSCVWDGDSPASWVLDELPSGAGLPDELTRAVLGGRSRILFHEGVVGSLDQELYEALLRGWTTVPSGNCRAVLSSVQGLNGSSGYHWVEARGVVDKDFRNEVPPANVLLLRQHEIENIFYMRAVIDNMASLQARAFGLDESGLSADALARAKGELRKAGVRSNIISKRVSAAVRDKLSEEVQSITSAPMGPTHTIECSVPTLEIENQYDSLIGSQGDIDDFLLQFPIRESGVRTVVSNALKYLNASYYEAAVIQQVRSDSQFRSKVLAVAGLGALQSI